MYLMSIGKTDLFNAYITQNTMDRLSAQTSIQALDIYTKVMKTTDLDLSITSSGNIRIATKFDRAVNAIADHFRLNSIEQRREQAKQVIRQKFDFEMNILGNHLSTVQRKFLDGALNLMIDGEEIENMQKSIKVESKIAAFNSALKHIRAMGSGNSKESNRIAWQATQEFVANGKRLPDEKFAQKVSELTLQWKKELKLSDRAAYRLAFNAASLCRRHGIHENLAREILQVSGKLHTRENIERDNALQLAIDLYIPMKKLGIGIESIGRLRQTLSSTLPELKNLDPITQISAAVCYFQLKETNLSDSDAYDQIRGRLKQIKVMQHIMPKGCEVNQIHQGSHVRGYVDVDKTGLKNLSDKVSTLTNYPTFNRDEVKTKLPDEYQTFEHQFVKDFVRGFNYELRQDGVEDVEFQRIESKRRRMMISQDPAEKMSQDDFLTWARHYQRHAGSITASEASSRLQSQTFFAEVENITADESSNVTGYKTKVSGDERPTEMRFSSDKRIIRNETVIDFKVTQKIKAVVLLADPVKSDETYLPPASVQLGLLVNDEWLPKMEHSNPTVTRECQLTVASQILDAGKTDCTNQKISEAWDLMPDWDNWMSKLTAEL